MGNTFSAGKVEPMWGTSWVRPGSRLPGVLLLPMSGPDRRCALDGPAPPLVSTSRTSLSALVPSDAIEPVFLSAKTSSEPVSIDFQPAVTCDELGFDIRSPSCVETAFPTGPVDCLRGVC